VLRSWFPESAPGRKRRGARPGMEQPYHSGQFHPQGRDDRQGNRTAPQNPGRGPRPQRSGSPGNSVHDLPYGHPDSRTPHGGPRRGGSMPGNSTHEAGNRAPSGNRAPGGNRPPGGNRGRGGGRGGPRSR
jgi:hypothetical protein